MGQHDLRKAIENALRDRGPLWTYVIANTLRRTQHDGMPATYPGATTAMVRRELMRMEREGLVKRLSADSGIHILWGWSGA